MTASKTPPEPAELDALIALAQRERAAGRLDAAAAAYHQILALRPDIAQVHNDLGIVLAQQGNLDQARSRFEQALALEPGYVDAHNNLGNVLLFQGQLDQAAARYQQALALRPDYAQAHYNLGNTLKAQGQLDRARACYEQALALRPDHAEAYNNLGNVLQQQGQLDQAAARYQQALTLRPNYADAHFNLGNTLRQQGQLERAAACFQQALALRPDHVEAHNNLGNVLQQQGKLDEATARFLHALALRPDYADAHYNLGFILREQGRLDEAAARFQHALALRPDLADAEWGLATCYLLTGDYQRGWPAFEARLRMPGHVVPHSTGRWTGQPLDGRSVLLVAEQGLGDTILFVRYARLLKARGARVLLAAHAPLGRLLAANPAVDEFFALGSADQLPRADFYLPLLSAPAALGTDAASIPSEVPYIWADPELTDRWRQQLARIEGFKIGIAWQGSRKYPWDALRSVPLAHFAPLARLPGVRLVSLQQGFGSEQVATVDFPVLDFSGRLDAVAGAFMDTAAVIRGLDLVVTVDSAIAHLAGALGVPVWTALHFSPYWIWQLDRDDSAWYPTMRLFRQTAFGQWPDVFDRIATAVQARRSNPES